jgi:hypothetical protein
MDFMNKALEKGKGIFVWGCPLFAGTSCDPYLNERIASKEILGHNLVKILMFQVQPVACCELLVSFYQFEIYSIDSS